MKKVIFFLIFLLFCCNFDDNPPVDEKKEGLLIDTEYRSFLLDSLSKAQKDVKVMMFAAIYSPGNDYAANDVFITLKALNENGVNIKLILDKTTASNYPQTTNFLTQNDIDFKLYNSDFSLHSKMVIIDDEILILGSHNWTEAAFLYNKEVSFYTTKSEMVERAKKYFDRLYNEIH
ncbi:MAG: phospholipase D-like domain-containing protein [Brevinematia bacterium]